jgi:hypothetical protein
MATVTLKSDGTGDYTSIVTWESSEQGVLAEPHTLECFKGTTEVGNWDANGHLNEAVTIGGWTTDATNFITVKTGAGQGHGGVDGVGFTLRNNVNGIFQIDQDYTVIEDLIVQVTASPPGNTQCFNLNAANVIVRRCIGSLVGYDPNRNHRAFQCQAENTRIENCLAICDDTNSSITCQGFHLNVNNTAVDNCTAVNFKSAGFASSAGNATRVYQNCVSYNPTTFDFNTNAQNSTLSHCASADTTAVDTSPLTGLVAADFVNYQSDGTGDYRPASGNQLDGANNPGADLSGTFTDDITGGTRTLPWERGAYDIIAGGVTFDGPDIVAQTGTQDQVFTFDENGEGTVASRFSVSHGRRVNLTL